MLISVFQKQFLSSFTVFLSSVVLFSCQLPFHQLPLVASVSALQTAPKNSMTTPTPTPTTLTYWNGRGKAESIRLLLAICGEDYTEQVPLFGETTYITTVEHVHTLRKEGYLLMNQLPLLCIDGMRLVQSGAITRYLAKKHHLCGDGTVAEEVLCDMLNDSITDYRTMGYGPFEFSLTYEPTPEQLAKLLEASIKYIPLFERQLQKNNKYPKGHKFDPEDQSLLYLVGSKYTYPDFRLWELLVEVVPHLENAFKKEYPCVARYYTRMQHHAGIQQFVASEQRKTKTQDGIPAYKTTVMTSLGY